MEIIELNENYRIEKDTYSWVLIFNEQREKLNSKTLEKESFLFEDKWYYPDVKQLLKKFIDLDLKESNSLLELSKKMDDLTSTINELKSTIFKR